MLKSTARKCIKCQQAKLPTPIHALMNSIPIGRTWQMIAVHILEAPVSINNSHYLMVVQDYLCTQTREGHLKAHFEETLETFGTKKTHTTPYHPQGDGMVERFNRSLLQLLRTYMRKKRIGNNIFLKHCMSIILLNTHLLGYHLLIDVWPTTKDASYWNTSSITGFGL